MAFALATPSHGIRANGNRAVAAIGRASVHQYVAIISTAYAHFPACAKNKINHIFLIKKL